MVPMVLMVLSSDGTLILQAQGVLGAAGGVFRDLAGAKLISSS